LAVKAQLHGVSDSNNLHDTRVGELLNPLAHGGLGKSDSLANICVRTTPIYLELFDDVFRHIIKPRWLRLCSHATIIATKPRLKQGKPQKMSNKTAES
jgi:hypothetical protein